MAELPRNLICFDGRSQATKNWTITPLKVVVVVVVDGGGGGGGEGLEQDFVSGKLAQVDPSET